MEPNVLPPTKLRIGSSYSLFLIGLVVVLFVGSIFFRPFDDFHTCRRDRFDPDTRKEFRSLPFSANALLGTTNLLTVIYGLQLLLWTSKKINSESGPKKHSPFDRKLFFNEVLFGLLFHVVWWFNTYCVVVFLKQSIADQTCNNKPNSVSGHFAFFTFLLLGLPYQSVRLLRDPLNVEHYVSKAFLKKVISGRIRPRTGLLLLTYFAIIIVSAVVTHRTYFYGFHSLYQILLGITMAVASHLIFVLVFNHSVVPTIHSSLQTRRLKLLIVLFGVEVGILLLLLFFTRGMLPSVELLMNMILLTILLVMAVLGVKLQ